MFRNNKNQINLKYKTIQGGYKAYAEKIGPLSDTQIRICFTKKEMSELKKKTEYLKNVSK